MGRWFLDLAVLELRQEGRRQQGLRNATSTPAGCGFKARGMQVLRLRDMRAGEAAVAGCPHATRKSLKVC